MNPSQAIGRVREVIRRQHKALSTEECYIFWLRRYIKALIHMPAGLSSEKKLERLVNDNYSFPSTTIISFQWLRAIL